MFPLPSALLWSNNYGCGYPYAGLLIKKREPKFSSK